MLSTDRQTNKQTKATKNITSFAKNLIIGYFKCPGYIQYSIALCNYGGNTDKKSVHIYQQNTWI